MTQIRLKRAYDSPSRGDGVRVLVDRLWPRGLKRDAAALDLWLKEIAPSEELRLWFGHEPARWSEFRKRYRAELRNNSDSMAALMRATKRTQPLTLVFAAKDKEHNNAVVLKDVMERRLEK